MNQTNDLNDKPSADSEEDAKPDAKRTRLDSSPPITGDARETATKQRILNLAVAGCSHGEMDRIYDTLAQIERSRDGKKFDLLICCGDFQAIRNRADLAHMKVPNHHKRLMTFYKYYSGEKVAPVLTLFIGGNHESSGFMAELPNGGWVAPNIYYMGYASVVRFGGLRIAGLSGIFKASDYDRGHYERPPFRQQASIISAYHVRSVDVFRLKQLRPRVKNCDVNPSRIHIAVSHDWPAGITDYGNTQALLRIKPYFREDIESNQLGNPATMELLHLLQPDYWFSAHMHVRYTAEVPHLQQSSSTKTSSPDKYDDGARKTKFLALDKPKNHSGRQFLECMEIPLDDGEEGENPVLQYDPTWLAILKNTNLLTVVSDRRVYMPGKNSNDDRYDFRPTNEELAEIHRIFNDDFRIPLNFKQTAPPESIIAGDEAMKIYRGHVTASLYYRNPQSSEFCEKLTINDLNYLLCLADPNSLGVPHYCEHPHLWSNATNANPEEINISNIGED